MNSPTGLRPSINGNPRPARRRAFITTSPVQHRPNDSVEMGSARALACRGRRPRRPHGRVRTSHRSVVELGLCSDRRGTGRDTRGRVSSPIPTTYLGLQTSFRFFGTGGRVLLGILLLGALVLGFTSVSTAAEPRVDDRSEASNDAREELSRFNFPALRLAIEDLIATFGSKYPKGKGFLVRLDELERSSSRQTLRGRGQSSIPKSPISDLPSSNGETSAVPGLTAVTSAPLAAGDNVDQLVAELRSLRREALLANPLLDFERLLLVRRDAARLGLPANWQGNCSLPRSGFDNEIAWVNFRETRNASPGSNPPLHTLYRPARSHFVGDLKLHFDADRLLFSSMGSHDRWQIFELAISSADAGSAASTQPRQVTPGDQPDVDNYDACYLPDGRMIFSSTAGMSGVPCVDGSDHVATLCRLEHDGRTIRQLCFDQDHNWSPTMMNDGRVLYQRWEYADVPHSQSRLLFQMNPDGTGQAEFYGSNSQWPNAMFYARPIPNHPTKIVAIVTGHHGVPRMGELILFDPAKGRHEADGVVQRIPGYGKKVEPIIRDQLVDDSWPKFLHPFPLDEKYFLVAAKPTPDSLWGIYLVDVFDNLVLLAEQPGQALLEPVPLRTTVRPPLVADRVDPTRQDALVYLADVYQGDGLKGIPRGTVKTLRLFAYNWAYQGMGGLLGTVGMNGPWDIRRLLGTVPVEGDGSAYFRVPANTPISVQPLDGEGKAVQLMRSWMTAMPGENLTCVGCHEKQNSAPAPAPLAAFVSRRPSEIKPWYGPARGFSFPREVQPVLDHYCVSCHDAKPRDDGLAPPDLRGSEQVADFRLVTPGHAGRHGGKFSVGYANLHRYVRHPGIESDYHMLTPMEYHADTTELVQLLKKGHQDVRLDAEAWDRLITWIDLNTPYHGTWHEEIADPGPLRARRNELRKLYAGMDDDAEVVPPGSAAGFVPPSSASRNEVIGGRGGARNHGNETNGIVATKSATEISSDPLPRVEGALSVLAGWPLDSQEAVRRQAAAGESIQRSLDLGGGVRLDLVLIPGGECMIGDDRASAEERPRTRVRIAQPYWMARTEVSNRQYAQFDATHDSHVESKNAYQFGVHGYPVNEPAQPVVRVSWLEADAFCRWLSSRTGLKCSLPTEGQWEYACRAGSATALSFGDGEADFARFANLADATLTEYASDPYTVCVPLKNPSQYEDFIPKILQFHDGSLVTMSVGGLAPNAWGLHDLHGNAWEWTQSAHRAYPYVEDDGRNVPGLKERRVVRGGSWRDRPYRATSAYRLSYEPWQKVFNVGFRIVCEDSEHL